ncbi:MAG TPA: hypothetical protein V6D29_01660 [Leptolyngbyaceae cyanobacterium]
MKFYEFEPKIFAVDGAVFWLVAAASVCDRTVSLHKLRSRYLNPQTPA